MVREDTERQIHRTSPISNNLNSQLKVLVFQCCCFCFYLHILVSKNFFSPVNI